MILNDLIRFSKISVRHKPEVTWPKSPLYKLYYYKPHHYHNQHNQNPLSILTTLFKNWSLQIPWSKYELKKIVIDPSE